MEKNNILNEANEALKRTLLMMNYDMKKTLSENVEVISEQSMSNQDICNLMYNGAHGSLGTKEDVLIKAFSNIKNVQQFREVDKCYGSSGKESSLKDMLNAEMDSTDTTTIELIKNSLASAGIYLTYKEDTDEYGTPFFVEGSINISDVKPTKTTADMDTLRTYLSSNSKKVEDSTVNGVPTIRATYPNSMVDYANNGRFYQFTLSGVLTRKGNWKMENGQLVSTVDGTPKSEQDKKDTTAKKDTTIKKTVPPVTDKKILDTLNFEYTFPGDNTYVYDFVPNTTMTEDTTVNGTWYAKNTKTGKVFKITGNYPSTEKKLDARFPDAKNKSSEEEIPAGLQNAKNLNTTSGQQTGVEDIKSKGLEASPIKVDMTPKTLNLPKKETTKPESPETFDPYGPATSVKESVKKSLKKNLNVLKENKENLMVETNIVEKRFKFIAENMSIKTEKDQNYLVESIISEVGYLKAQNYSSQAINEGIFSMLGSLLGGAFKSAPQVFGEYVAGWLLKQFGVSKESYLGSSITALVGNLNISDYDRFFSDCRFASNKIADSLIEGYVLKLQQEKGFSEGASGFLVSAMRNSVVDYFTEDKNSLVQILEDKIGEYLCPKLSKLGGVINDKTEDIKAKVAS